MNLPFCYDRSNSLPSSGVTVVEVGQSQMQMHALLSQKIANDEGPTEAVEVFFVAKKRALEVLPSREGTA